MDMEAPQSQQFPCVDVDAIQSNDQNPFMIEHDQKQLEPYSAITKPKNISTDEL